ncbi:mitochondrial carrier [Cystobasidium minutum MCA 4210]|uniref:mitochondrial carrier n=1 Tax=Cystobasidium minutum MCA 4210 TaxID=1397322 RepID=UPI0034CE628A|eukprot:jgi/Rhomi1/146749/e_gw1.7.68.1
MSAKRRGKQRAEENDVIENSAATQERIDGAKWIPAKSWVHFVAGGLGGMSGAIVTAPFDVVKTRLQSDLFSGSSKATTLPPKTGVLNTTRRLLYHFVETGILLRDIARNEGPSALFRGLGPTLVGVIPARSINFFVYGNGKQIYAKLLNDGKEAPGIHLISAATAGIATAAATNPIWVVKTRLQLQSSSSSKKANPVPPAGKNPASSAAFSSYSRIASQTSSATPGISQFTPSFGRSAATLSAASADRFTGSMQCIAHIWRNEGIKGFYRGLSASLLGVAEGTIQWTLYEKFKAMRRRTAGSQVVEEGWLDRIGAAGGAKLIATIITYPHEVVRTRLRQAPPVGSNKPKYHGLLQSFKLILKEEGVAALYSGLSPHLLRVVPNAAVMYTVYEVILKWSK